jgi:phospholipase D1/2
MITVKYLIRKIYLKFRIAFTIRKRIEKANENKEKFHVFILLPVIPAFSGDIKETQSLKTILKYTYRTICRHNGLSLIEKLIEKIGVNYTQYISFYTLRTHDDFNGVPKSSSVYIHSKILIVDDIRAIIGSNNINDRSLLGDRDSELAVVINGGSGEDLTSSLMNGVLIEKSKVIFNFRMNLFKLHLGVTTEDDPTFLFDPLDEKLINYMYNLAFTNTISYREIFKPIQDDIFSKFSEFDHSYNDKCSKCLKIIQENYKLHKQKIKGFLVQFPLNFLKDENLDRGLSKERLVPVNLIL